MIIINDREITYLEGLEITKEEVLNLPHKYKGKKVDEFRERVRQDMENCKRHGYIMDFDSELP